jgi:hypothetical protein
MKLIKIFLAFNIAVILFASCKSASNKAGDIGSNADKTSVLDKVENINKISEIVDQSKVRGEELKKIPPISNDVLKSFFKEEVAGAKRSSFSVQNTSGFSVGQASYKENDSVTNSITIYDCAGEEGAGFYSMMLMTKLNIETEDNNGFSKTVDFMGSKALKTYKNYDSECSFSFVSADRFWLQINGTHTSFEKLQTFIDAIELSKLTNLK